MKQTPILFSTEMVKSILKGTKSQTRRLLKPQPLMYGEVIKMGIPMGEFATTMKQYRKKGFTQIYTGGALKGMIAPKCPYGEVGDMLWVRETWGVGTRPNPFVGWVDGFEFKADEEYIDDVEDLPLYQNEDVDFSKYEGRSGWRPSIHMPKAACRIFLKITDIRAERLQEISETDAKAEGIEEFTKDGVGFKYGIKGWNWSVISGKPFMCYNRSIAFAELWKSINGDKSWDDNPWVWVVSFERIEKPEN